MLVCFLTPKCSKWAAYSVVVGVGKAIASEAQRSSGVHSKRHPGFIEGNSAKALHGTRVGEESLLLLLLLLLALFFFYYLVALYSFFWTTLPKHLHQTCLKLPRLRFSFNYSASS